MTACPFCGRLNVRYENGEAAFRAIILYGRRGHYYLCLNCEAQGPQAENKEKALEYWNDRKEGEK